MYIVDCMSENLYMGLFGVYNLNMRKLSYLTVRNIIFNG